MKSSFRIGDQVRYSEDGVGGDDPTIGRVVHVFTDNTALVEWEDGETNDIACGELINITLSERIEEKAKDNLDVVAAMQTLADHGITDPVVIAILVNTHSINSNLPAGVRIEL